MAEELGGEEHGVAEGEKGEGGAGDVGVEGWGLCVEALVECAAEAWVGCECGEDCGGNAENRGE